MRLICFLLVTSFFSLSFAEQSSRENNGLPYAQKILLEAEYARAETTLESQFRYLEALKADIDSGKEIFDEVRGLVENIFVFSLERLYETNQKREFTRLAQLLNSDQYRGNFYYPVQIKGGFSGKHQRYVAWKYKNCVRPLKEDQIKTGTFIKIETPAFERFNLGDTALIIIEKTTLNENGKTRTLQRTLANLKLDDASPEYQIIKDLESIDTDLTEFYSCANVNRYLDQNKKNKKLHLRYLKLAKILNKEPKSFTEKKEPQPKLKPLPE